MASTKILIVEDESIVALDLRRILTRAGYTVTQIVSTGTEAIASVKAQPPEVVLMDIGLSGDMNGIVASKYILEIIELPIIFVTANSDFATVQQAQTTNPFGYILKPFDEREIRIVVEMALYKHRLDQEIKENRAWLFATLHSIGDAVIATDANAVIKFMNPLAEKITGWTEAEAIGKPLAEVFRIINEETRQEVSNPAHRALQEGQVVGLANHTLLIARDGNEVHIDDAAAPILDTRQKVNGVVLTFRDVTEKRRAEDKLRQQNDYLASLHETSLALLNRLDMIELLEIILTRASELIGTPNGVIDFLDPDKKIIRQIVGIGIYQNQKKMQHSAEEGISGKILRTGKTVFIDDYDTFPERTPLIPKGQLHAMVGVPLKSSEQLIGVLGFAYTESGKTFSDEQVKMLESFAELASIAIDNARLYTSTQQEIKDRRLAEDAFRLAASQLRLLTDNMLDMVIRTDMEGAILYASPSVKTTLGYDPDWLVGHSLFEFVHPDDLPQVMTIVQVSRESTGSGRMELRYRRSDNHYIWLEAIGNMVYDDDNKMIGAVFSIREVTQRKQSETLIERNLKESETLAAISRALNETLDLENILQMIADSSRQIVPNAERAVIHLLDDDNVALRAAAISGIENRNQPVVSMRRGEGIAGRVVSTGKLINVGNTQEEAGYIPLRSDSSLRSVLSIPIQRGINIIGTLSIMSDSINAFSEDDERILSRLGVQAALAIDKARTYDVERRRAEQAEALHQVTQSLIGHIKLDEALETIVNTIAKIARYKYVRIFLIEHDMLNLRAQNEASKVKVKARPLTEGIIGRVARTGMPTLVPNVALDPDYVEGMPGTQSSIAVPLKKDQAVSGILIVESDAERALNAYDLYWLISIGQAISLAMDNISLYTNLQEALKQEKNARTQLVRTEKLAGMGRLIASVAHELNNPLQAIQNALFLVKHETGLSAQANEDLQVALGEADRMAELIGRLRETYRPTTVEQFQPASLNSLVIETQRLMATHARHNNVTFDFTPDADLPLLSCLQDEIKQVLLNLSLNAVEAMPNGGKIVMTTGHNTTPAEVWITVADSGIGIDPNTIANIFDPFFTTKASGTGLGLFITHEIVQKHNGRIEVESQRNVGTTFKAIFPAYNLSNAINA